MKRELTELLDRGASRGIITTAQRDALGALAVEMEGPAGPEVRRGLNSVTVTYGLGALLVVFGFGWFLADRWEALGAGGVLVVVLVYAVLLTGIALWLDKRGFREAAGVALLVATVLTPLASWALQSLAGLWPSSAMDPLVRYGPWMALRFVISELATIGVALVAFRWRRHVVLTIPMAVALWGLWTHLALALVEEPRGVTVERWLMLANGLAICAVAGALERWQGARPESSRSLRTDFAGVFWVAGLIAFAVAYMGIWLRASDSWKHLLPLVALVLIVMSLYLRRRLHLAVGVAGVFGYLAWLGGDVFKDWVSFPVLLATLGILLILSTVGLQRRFPQLVERVNAGRDGNALPRMVTLGPLLLAAGVALISLKDLPEERAQRAFEQRLRILQGHSGSLRLRNTPPGPRDRPRPAAATPTRAPTAGNK